MKKTVGICTLGVLLSLLLVGAEEMTEVPEHLANTIPLADIPMETPMYTAWGVWVQTKDFFDMASTATNVAYQAMNRVDGISNLVEQASDYANVAQSNAIVAANSAANAISIAQSAGATAGKAWNLALVNSNRIDSLEERIGPGPVPDRRIALFILQLNASATTNGYSGFELKASTNNFAHFTDSTDLESGRLLYWSASVELKDVISEVPTGRCWDNMWVFSCDDKTPDYEHNVLDNRSWSKWKELKDGVLQQVVYKYPRFVAVLVAPPMLHRKGHESDIDKNWLRESNDDLVWCYLRVNDEGGEKIPEHVDAPLWNVCQPVKWLSKIPNWANIQDSEE